MILVAAFSSRHESIRHAIAVDLARRGLLHEIRQAAESDPLTAIRALAFRDRLNAAIQRGGDRPNVPEDIPFDERRDLEVERLRGLPSQELKRKVEWLNRESYAAYEVLARDHWDEFGDQVRHDFSQNFERIREEWLEPFVQTIVERTGFSKDQALEMVHL